MKYCRKDRIFYGEVGTWSHPMTEEVIEVSVMVPLGGVPQEAP